MKDGVDSPAHFLCYRDSKSTDPLYPPAHIYVCAYVYS